MRKLVPPRPGCLQNVPDVITKLCHGRTHILLGALN